MKKLFSVLVFTLALTLSGIAQNNEESQDIFNDVQPAEEQPADPNAPLKDGEKKPAAPKPFVRLVLPIDSVTSLITYTEIVEQPESQADSLYIRAKRWAVKNFTKNGEKSKEIFEVDKKDNKLVIKGYIDAYVYGSKYSKKNLGYHMFTITIWIKEGRYKYTITNLYNVNKLFDGDKTEPTKTYFEYYNTTTTNPKSADSILRGADSDINKLIKDLKRDMRDPVQVDEDDW